MHTGMPSLLYDLTVLDVSLQFTAYGLVTCLQVKEKRRKFPRHILIQHRITMQDWDFLA